LLEALFERRGEVVQGVDKLRRPAEAGEIYSAHRFERDAHLAVAGRDSPGECP